MISRHNNNIRYNFPSSKQLEVEVGGDGGGSSLNVEEYITSHKIIITLKKREIGGSKISLLFAS